MITVKECPDCKGYGHNQEPYAPNHKYCETCDRTGEIEFCICKGCEKESDDPVARDNGFGGSGEVYHNWNLTDYNGFFTGYYCDKCYDDPDQYGFRKDNYNEDARSNGESIYGEADEWI